MILAFFLAAAYNYFPLVEETVVVPHAEWRSVDLSVHQPVLVECRFSVAQGKPPVRIMVLTPAEAKHLHAGRPYHVVFETTRQKSATMRFNLPAAEDYKLIVDNSASALGRTEVELQVAAMFPAAANVGTLSRARRAAVVSVSVIFFVAVAVFSLQRLPWPGR